MVRPLPEDPMVRNLINMVRKAQMNRRALLRGAAVGAAGAGTLALSACGSGGGGDIDRGDGSAGSIVWGNWTYYLDYDDEQDTYPSLDQFSAETNIDVQYVQDIDDNNTFFGKIKDQLAQGVHTGYDVLTMTDWMNARLIEAGQIQEFDHSNIPNLDRLLPSLVNSLDVDEGRHFTIPWQAPASGWVWNTELVPDGIYELDDFMRPELHGKVGVLTEMRDTMGMIMAAQGVDVAGPDWGDAEFDRALEWLDDGLQSGQIANVKGNSYTQDLETETTLAAMAWTGDVVMLNMEQGNRWTLEVPESGGMITADSFTVPNGTEAEEKALVEEMINYYYEPEVAAMVADYVNFVTPVEGAREAMESINPEQVENTLIFPDEEMDARLLGFRTLTSEEDRQYTEAFNRVLGV